MQRKGIGDDPKQWEPEDVTHHLAERSDETASFFLIAFGWTKDQYLSALDAAADALSQEGSRQDSGIELMGTAGSRDGGVSQAAEQNMLNARPDLFEPDAFTDRSKRPAWFPEGLTSRDRVGRIREDFDFPTITQAFIAHASSIFKTRPSKVADGSRPLTILGKRERPRSKSAQDQRRQWGPNTLTSNMKRTRLSTLPVGCGNIHGDPGSDVDMPDCPDGPVMEGTVIYTVRLNVTNKGLQSWTKKIILRNLAPNNGGKWRWCRAALSELTKMTETEKLYYWHEGCETWIIEDDSDLDSAVEHLWERAAANDGVGSIVMFIATGEHVVKMLPQSHRVPREPMKQTELILYAGLADDGSRGGNSQNARVEHAIHQNGSDPTHTQGNATKAARDMAVDIGTPHGEVARQQQVPIRETVGGDATTDDMTEHSQPVAEAPAKQPQELQGAHAVLTQPDQHIRPNGQAWPNMTRCDPDAPTIKKRTAPRQPSIRVPPGFELIYDPLLSSDTYEDIIARGRTVQTAGEDVDGNAGTDRLLARYTDASQMNPANWNAICEFVGFDPAEVNPRSTLTLKGLPDGIVFKPYQFFASGWIVKSLAEGHPLVIEALGMGLGKTPVSILAAEMMRRNHMSYPHTYRSPVPGATSGVNLPDSHPRSDSLGSLNKLVGGTPTVRKGIVLVICPKSLLGHWVREIRKFLGRRGPKIVIAHENRPFTHEERHAVYEGCYQPGDTVRPEDLPTRKQWAYDGYADHFLTEYMEHPPVVEVLLEVQPDKDSENEYEKPDSFLSDWWVLTTKDTFSKWFPTNTPRRTNRAQLQTQASLVIWDEFHLVKSVESMPFPTLATLQGNPQILALSATPFTKCSDIAPISIVSHAQYFESAMRKDLGARTAVVTHPWSLRPHEIVRENLTFRPELTKAQQDAIERSSYLGGRASAAEVDRFVASRTLHKASAESRETPMTDVTRKAVSAFGKWLRPQMIQFFADFWWQPDPNKAPLPGVDLPPHDAQSIFVPINEEFAESLRHHWEEDLSELRGGSDNQVRKSFLGLVSRWTVYLLWNNLRHLMSTDPALEAELSSFNVAAAKRVTDAGKNSRLWRYMPQIHNMESMLLWRNMLSQFRSQKNALGFGRKVIVVAHKPFNMAVFNLYMVYLAELEEFNSLSCASEFALVTSWSSRKRNEDSIRRFQTTQTTAEGYSDAPFVLCAVASQIRVGLSLSPADAIVVLDGTWLGADTEQVIGRIQRSREVQKAEFTESFQLISISTWCRLGEWQASRRASHAEIWRYVNETILDLWPEEQNDRTNLFDGVNLTNLLDNEDLEVALGRIIGNNEVIVISDDDSDDDESDDDDQTTEDGNHDEMT